MAIELEAKLSVESHDAVRTALVHLAADRVSRVVESNYIFDRPDGSFRAQGKALRVRAFHVLDGPLQKAVLTYKGPAKASCFKAREEREVDVGDAQATLDILNAAGFMVSMFFEKRRETWRIDGCLVELDELPILGRFVEIEGPTEDAITTLQNKLGLSSLEHIATSYVGMLNRYCAENNISDRKIRFET